MAESILSFDKVQQRLPPALPGTNLAAELVNTPGLPVLVVLDDDPTGTQTCHAVNVLTVWDEEILVHEL